MKYPRIAEAMKQLMDEHDGNKAAVARELKTDATSVAQWLSGERFPSKPTSIAAIAKHTGHSIEWLANLNNRDDSDGATASADINEGTVDIATLDPTMRAALEIMLSLSPEELEPVCAVLQYVKKALENK